MKRNQHKPVDAAELRRNAEKRLKRQKPAGREQRTELGTARLVHELQVHQIELEMQNEELRQARTEMETLLARYTNLYDFAPTGYLNLDREGAIRQVNLTGARLLGVERSRLMNRRFGLFVSDDFRPAFKAFLQKVFASHTKECCEVALLNEGRRPLFVRIESVISEDGQECLVMVMDITEHRQAEEQALHESEARHRTILRTAMDGFWLVDLQGRLLEVNETYCGMSGYSEKELLALSIPDLEAAETTPADTAFHIQRVVAQGEDRFESRHRRKDGSSFAVEASVQYKPAEGGQIVVFLRDITERKQAEDALRAQNTELQILHETSQTILASPNIQHMAASILDKALAVSLCDLGVIRLLDRTSMTLDPVASHGYLNPKNLQRHHRHLDDGTTGRLLRIFARKETVVSERVQDGPGLRIFKSEGVQSLILIPVLAEHDLLGALQLGSRTPRKFDPHLINLLETLGSNFGIAVQKNRLLEETLASQAQLRALSRRLVETQESERHHLARELHDEIGSLLTGIKLTLGVSAGSGTDQIDARTAAAHAIIDEALVKTRSLSHSLRPPMLDDLGLLSALSWHIKEFTARANVQVNFQHHDLQGRFPEEVEIAAYRIVQEALTNIARHAQVHEATVTLWADQSGLGIEISDQGAGFDQTATLANASGIGLAGIRERVASLGGSLTITSAPAAGTSVAVELPLATEEKTVRSEQ
jgi:PAS domain S-box-containing protein